MSAGGVVKALRSLGIISIAEVSTVVAEDVRPTAYRGPWPIRSHRTLEEVDAGVSAR